MRILQRNLKHTTDTFLFISHTTNIHLFKFRCNIFIGFRIIKEMPGSLVSGTLYTISKLSPRVTQVSVESHWGQETLLFSKTSRPALRPIPPQLGIGNFPRDKASGAWS